MVCLSLVEDGDAGKLSTGPFAGIFLELGVHRLEKGAHEGDLECWPDNRTLLHDIADCRPVSYCL